MKISNLVNGGNLQGGAGFNGFHASGPIILFRHPQEAMESATKGYIDTNLCSHVNNTTIHLTVGQSDLLASISATGTEINALSNISGNVQSQIDSKVNLAGDTMTGALTLSGAPTSALHAVTKQYVDDGDIAQLATISSKLPLAGGTMTGSLTLAGSPTNTLHAATKAYVDDTSSLRVAKSGDTMTGALTLAGNPTAALHAASKDYVDSNLSSHTNDASLHLTPAQNTFIDGVSITSAEVNQLSGVSSNVQTQINGKFDKTGGTISGDVTMGATNAVFITKAPATGTEAVNKTYVDNNLSSHTNDNSIHITPSQNTFLDGITISSAEANYLTGVSSNVQSQLNAKLPLTGGSLSGFLTLSADPTSSLHAATKAYVDSSITTHTGDVTIHLTSAQNTLLDGITVSSAEINSLSGVTSNVQTQLGSKLPLAGGTLTGSLTLAGDPTTSLQAATKSYVDAGISTHSGDQSLHLTPTQNTFIDSLTVNATEVNHLTGVSSNVQGQINTKLALAGGTMIGDLTLSGAPTLTLHASTKGYVDSSISGHGSDTTLHLTSAQNTFLDAVTVTSGEVNQLSGVSSNIQSQLGTKLPLAGGTMTGAIVLAADPSALLHPATKQYTDAGDALKVAKSGDTMTGALTLSGAPTLILHAATKGYVDSTVTSHASDATLHLTSGQNTFLDAVSVSATEVNYLSGVTSAVQTQLNTKLPLAGGTMTGAITLAADPAAALQPATKQYTDAANALKVAKAGDTMTGFLTLSAAPTSTLHAATKGYVDTHISDAAVHLTTAQNTWIDAITATSAEVNYLSGVTSAVQTQINSKFDKTGGTITGDVTMGATNAIFISKTPVGNTEAVNKAYVDSLLAGREWKDPVSDINLVHDNLSTPPGSPVVNDVYIVGASPTGAWVGKAGYATYWNGSAWVWLQTRAVAVGDRFGVSLTSATVVSGSLTAYDNKLVTISNATVGSIAYTADTVTAGASTLVFDPDSSKFGVSYTYTDEGTWVPTNTSVNIVDGSGLSFSGNTLNVNAGDGLQISSDTVAINLDANGGITTTAGKVLVKLDGATLASSATGLKVADATISSIAAKLPLAGGTMTGAITLAADPAAAMQPATKQYTDTANALKVSKSGDTMTGALTLSGAPTVALHAATKGYVDTHISDTTVHLTSAQNTFIDAITATSTEVNYLSGVTSSVQTQLNAKLPLAGGTMTGAITLAADPASALQPATKQYTDTADALKVAKSGDTMTGALTLSGVPTLTLHAATKGYVDSALSGHSTDAALHLTTAQNTWIDSITATAAEVNYLSGATSNVQTQLSAKLPLAGGTMTGAITLAADPAAAMQPATKQYTDTATGLKVNKAGDTMTGALTLSGAPTAALHAATKAYVDALDSIKPGTVIQRFNATVPAGYLYCDGSFVNKTTYASLFTELGSTFDNVSQCTIIDYTKYTALGEGRPWINQYEFSAYSGTNLNNTVQSGTIPASLTVTQAVVTKNKVYLLGGYNGSAVSTVYSAPINADGTLGAWSAGTALPGTLSHSYAVVTENRVYLLGGSSDGANSVSTVYTATIDSSGNIGTWSAATALPGALSRTQAIVTRNRIYLLGGSSNGTNAVSTVYTAPIDSSGVIGAWTTGTALPSGLRDAQSVVTKNSLYLLGGHNGTSAVATVYKAPINSDGTIGAWAIDTSLPAANYGGLVVANYNNIFYLGGYNSTNVYRGTLTTNGDISSWTAVTSLNHALSFASGIVTRDKIYFLGSYLATTITSNVYYIDFVGSGINDYSLLYDGSLNNFVDSYIFGVKTFGTLGAPNANVFRLPDYSNNATNSEYLYIKY